LVASAVRARALICVMVGFSVVFFPFALPRGLGGAFAGTLGGAIECFLGTGGFISGFFSAFNRLFTPLGAFFPLVLANGFKSLVPGKCAFAALNLTAACLTDFPSLSRSARSLAFLLSSVVSSESAESISFCTFLEMASTWLEALIDASRPSRFSAPC